MKRTIRLKCIKDPHIVEFVDGGIDREGNPSSQRQALMRVLSKRVTATVDNKEAIFPIFLVESVGEWSKAKDEALPDSDEWRAFEDDVVRREHPESMMVRWKKAQSQFIAESVEAKRLADAQMEQLQSADIAKSIQGLVRNVAQNTSARKASA